jgi:hypothetical protein
MNTLIDVFILVSAYVSLSLLCGGLLRLLWSLPQRASYEQVTRRGW